MKKREDLKMSIAMCSVTTVKTKQDKLVAPISHNKASLIHVNGRAF